MFLYLEDIYSQNDWADSVYSKVQQYHQYTLKNIMRFYKKKILDKNSIVHLFSQIYLWYERKMLSDIGSRRDPTANSSA